MNRKEIIEAIKNSGKVRTAEWKNKDEWDCVTCSSCGDGNGYDTERFCSKCGCFMVNYEPDRIYHYRCKHCGASFDDVMVMEIIQSQTESQPQIWKSRCEACGEYSELTFADADIEIVQDSFDEELMKNLGIWEDEDNA